MQDMSQLLNAFESDEELVVNTGAEISPDEYRVVISEIPELAEVLKHLGYSAEDLKDGEMAACGIEFILEGLHLNNSLNKHIAGKSNTYEAGKSKRYQLGA